MRKAQEKSLACDGSDMQGFFTLEDLSLESIDKKERHRESVV